MRRYLPALAVLLVLPLFSLAEKPTPSKKPLGTWQRQSEGLKITFAIKPDSLQLTLVDESGNKTKADAAIGLTNNNLLFGVITEVDSSGQGPEKGDLFSFNYEVKNGQLVISDLKGTRVNDEARKHVEGEYKSVGK
jgi:hypothetical protein